MGVSTLYYVAGRFGLQVFAGFAEQQVTSRRNERNGLLRTDRHQRVVGEPLRVRTADAAAFPNCHPEPFAGEAENERGICSPGAKKVRGF